MREKRMKLGTMGLPSKTIKGICYAGASFMVLVAGVAFCLLLASLMLPEARELPWR